MYFNLVYFSYISYIITYIGIIPDVNGQTLEDVRKLKKALFVDQPYDIKMRPIQNQSNQVVVSLTLCTLMDCPIHIWMGLSIIHFKGSYVKISK